MNNKLLEICNAWQITRIRILDSDPDMRMTIAACEKMIEQAFQSSTDIITRVDWDKRKAKGVNNGK